MKKYIYVVLFSVFLLQGCTENVKITNNVSEDSIKNKDALSVTEQENIVEHRYANSNGFYVFDNEKGVLQQWTWKKGTIIAEYENLEIQKLLLVTDRYIYYQTIEEGEKKSKTNSISVFCIPIQAEKGKDIVKDNERRKIFTIQVTSGGIYELSKYGDQIICLTDDSQLFLYNEKEEELKEVEEDMGSLNFANHTAASIFKGSIYLTDDKIDGLYELNLKENTKRLEQINDCCVNSFVCDKDTAFYSGKSLEQEEPVIYSVQKENPFLTYTDIKQMLSSYKKIKQGIKLYNCIDIDIYVLTIFENRLYFSVEFGYEPYGVDLRKKVILSVDVNNPEDVCIEEKLNDFLQEVYECSDGAESNGNILEVVSGKCLVMGEKGKKFEDSVGVPYIYDLRDGGKKRLSKKDSEWWYCYYNYPMD